MWFLLNYFYLSMYLFCYLTRLSVFASLVVFPNSVLKFIRTSHFEVLRELLILTKISKKILITFSLKGQQSVFITLSNLLIPFWLLINGFKTSRTTMVISFGEKWLNQILTFWPYGRKWSLGELWNSTFLPSLWKK